MCKQGKEVTKWRQLFTDLESFDISLKKKKERNQQCPLKKGPDYFYFGTQHSFKRIHNKHRKVN